MTEIKPITPNLQQSIRTFVIKNWGSPLMVSRGKTHRIDQLPGFAALNNNKIVGLITYNIEEDECEIISLDSLAEDRGIGSRLLDCVIKTAQEKDSRRVWLITSNDNLHAMRFYQKRGFNMIAVHVNAINEARKIKPEIPEIGIDGIPIRHEVEFELNLSGPSTDGHAPSIRP